MSVVAYVALGSNLGDRQHSLESAVTALRDHPAIIVRRVSSWLDTEPVGGPAGQGRYLNGVTEIDTTLSAEELLRLLLQIEQSLGRVRAVRFGPRTIDLDLLLYGNETREGRDLTLPHPRLHERAFVLQPLVEIAPDVVHPELGRTARELLDELRRAEAAPSPRPRRRALVTGSTTGIGRAIALELADAGSDVLIHGRRSSSDAEQVAHAVRERGVRSRVLMADLADPLQGAQLIDAAWEVWGGLDILVNNAGADTLTGAAARWPFEQKLDALWQVDVRATMQLSRLVGERMKTTGGVIVNMGWDQAETGMEGDSGQLFAAVKAAVMAFSKSLALSLAPEVRVNCVAPGWIRTAWGETASATWQERVQRETPLRRWGTPEDVAKTVRWLVSNEAAFVTGQVVRVNGGAVR